MDSPKTSWRGTLLAVQPRIRLTRSFDERSHSYLGYVLFVRGTVAGEAVAVANPEMEPAEFYKASALKVLARGAQANALTPPWLGAPPALETYRARGHRRLDARTYEAKCRAGAAGQVRGT